jgi:hypothetical protein
MLELRRVVSSSLDDCVLHFRWCLVASRSLRVRRCLIGDGDNLDMSLRLLLTRSIQIGSGHLDLDLAVAASRVLEVLAQASRR